MVLASAYASRSIPTSDQLSSPGRNIDSNLPRFFIHSAVLYHKLAVGAHEYTRPHGIFGDESFTSASLRSTEALATLGSEFLLVNTMGEIMRSCSQPVWPMVIRGKSTRFRFQRVVSERVVLGINPSQLAPSSLALTTNRKPHVGPDRVHHGKTVREGTGTSLPTCLRPPHTEDCCA